ncbi:MAG: hypothetical protein WKG07_13670 [Hymenobacter sp.]
MLKIRDFMKLFKSADLIRKSKYISRDLSWLRFNYRVLRPGQGPRPLRLFDRLRFMSITSSNLDEFFDDSASVRCTTTSTTARSGWTTRACANCRSGASCSTSPTASSTTSR